MDTSYSADPPANLDEAVVLAAGDRKSGEPIRIRLQPSIYQPSVKQHRDWPGVSWSVECTDPEEALGLRDALRVFFQALRTYGPASVIRALQPPPSAGEVS